MALSPTGPLYAGAASAAADWSTISNAVGLQNGTYAENLNEGPGGGGHFPTQLSTSSHGFSLPTTAVIDGIMLEAYVYGGGPDNDNSIGVGTNTKASTSAPNFGQNWPIGGGWLTWGGSTSLWGRTDWTAADINDSSFGANLSAMASHATSNIGVDSVRITVYWHAAPAKIPRTKYYLYKVFDSITGQYLGNLPNVVSDFGFPQDINTGGTQITVQCGVSADISGNAADYLEDEAGNILTDESSITLTDEGQSAPTGIGTSNALIRDGNAIQVWEYGYYHVNGICMFSGVIERHEDNFGGDTGDDTVKLFIYSDGSDMDNHLVRGSPFTYTGDVTQTSQNTSAIIQTFHGTWNRYGQTWKVGVGVTNLGAISLRLNGTANVTVQVWDSPNLANMLGTVTQFVSVGTPTEVQFTYPLHIPVTAGNTYFFVVLVDDGQSITIYYQNSDVYANGAAYNSSYGGGGGGSYGIMAADLYFKTFSTSGSTSATFTSVDPTSGMLVTIVDDYLTEGGKIGIGNIQTSGLSLSYGFNTATVYQALQATLTIAPSGYYYYVDLGYDLLYFQRANTQADYVLTKGIHINKLTVVSTIEYVINACYVVGGVVAGSSIYTLDLDYPSINRYGLRLQVHTDNNITNTTAAHTVGSSIVADNKDEQYQTTVTILDGTMDITLLVPGKIIGFNGFGSYVDGLLAQIVHRNYTPDYVTLTLGILPKRNATDVDQMTRNLVALSTIVNPSSPS